MTKFQLVRGKEKLLDGSSGKAPLKGLMAYLLSSFSFPFFLPEMRKYWLEFSQPLCEYEAVLSKEAIVREDRSHR